MTAPEKDDVLPPYRRVSAETLRLATEATGAPEHLRGLARAVRRGEATWAQITDGAADDLPAVRAANAVVAAKVRDLTEPPDETTANPDPSDWDDDEPEGNIIFRKSC